MLHEKPYTLYQVIGETEYLVCHVTRLSCEDEYRAMLSEIITVVWFSNLHRVLFDASTAEPQVSILKSHAFGDALMSVLPPNIHIAAVVNQRMLSRGFTRMVGRYHGPNLATFTNLDKAVAWLLGVPKVTGRV
jgi:hypothetical protein